VERGFSVARRSEGHRREGSCSASKQSALLKECEKERKKIEEQRKRLLKQREEIEEEKHEKKDEEEFYVGELDDMMMEYNRLKPK
jgi:uncharacterized membrane protein YukC